MSDNKYEPKYSEAAVINNLIAQYGPKTTLEDLLRHKLNNNIYKCPKCDGRGYIKCKYNGYPSGLPDSGWVYEEAFKDVKCDVCNGVGYTEKPMKPKMVQDGWEVSE
jgi:hypothetical protein